MLYRTLGKTNEKVSILGFGAMRLPVRDGRNECIDHERAAELIRYALDHGVNFVDTAYTYHSGGFAQPGMSEPFLGELLAQGYRDHVLVSTKLPPWMVESPGDMDKILNHQLERLRTEHIDCYLLHGLTAASWTKMKNLGGLTFLDKAKAEGRIRYAGFSFHDELPLFKEIVSAYSWDFCLIQYNFLDVEFQAGRAGLRHAAKKGLGVMVMEPVKGGRLAGHIPAAVQALWDQAPIKREPAEWALRFVWNEPEVSLVLSGMSSLEQVQKNVAWAEAGTPGSLSPEELDIVERVRQEYRRRLRVACTGCGYCKPCPAGIDILFMLDCLNNLACFEDLAGVNFSYNFSVKAGNTAAASACEACGQCEDACPQHLPIMAALKEAVALFEI